MSRNIAIAALVSVVFGLGSVSAQPPAPPALPAEPGPFGKLLSLPKTLCGALVNRHGKHPKLEKKPPLKPIADPANLLSEDPALKRAAEIKAEEDKAKQKIKAIRYLAFIGCGCYDKDGSITEALAAKLSPTEECTERVRLAAVEAIHEVASGVCCSQCGETCCCNEIIVKALAKSAYHRDDKGCYVEPSERVREAAAEALIACCPDSSPPVEIATEENGGPQPKVPETGDGVPESGDDNGPIETDENGEDDLDLDSSDITQIRNRRDALLGPQPQHRPAPTIDPRAYQDRSMAAVSTNSVGPGVSTMAFTQHAAPPAQPAAGGAAVVQYAPPSHVTKKVDSWRGVITHVDAKKRLAQVKLENAELVLPDGAMLAAVQARNGRRQLVGPFRAVRTAAGVVLVVMPHGMDARVVRRGDVVIAAPQPAKGGSSDRVARRVQPEGTVRHQAPARTISHGTRRQLPSLRLQAAR